MKKNNKQNKDGLKEVKKSLDECLKEKEGYKTGWQRERADFLNFKRLQETIIKEKEESIKEEIILMFLPVLDNLEKGLRAKTTQNDFYKGVEIIYKQFKEALKNLGVEEISVSLGEDFNPKFHEAILVEKAKNGKKDIVIEVIEKGYLFNKKVLRPVKVKVSN